MTRFSLDDTSTFRDQFTYSDDSSENTFSSTDDEDDAYSVSDLEYEEPHPLGFGSTCFGLYSKDDMKHNRNQNQRYDHQQNESILQMDEMDLVDFFKEPLIMSRAISNNPTETGILVKHHQRRTRFQDNSQTDDLVHRMDRIAILVKAASSVPANAHLTVPKPTDKFQSLLQVAQEQRFLEQRAMEEMAIYSKQFLEKQRQDAEILLSLIKREEAQADMILRIERMEEEKVMEEEKQEIERIREEQRLKDEEAKRAEDIRLGREEQAERDQLQLEEQAERDKFQLEHRREQEREAKEAKRGEREAREAKKTEYVAKAKKNVGKLDQVRASLEVFETSKESTISRRRLQMKKVARGKMNTLSHEKEKVEIVTGQVVQALQACTQDDLALEQQMQSGDASITREMTRGARYLMDLIAATVIVRVQAEGFNGTRGDGFPLAHMLAHTSIQVKEDFTLLIAAHIYSVCPTAIPILPTPAAGCSELELMESLGMQKDKKGEFETFDRFLARTEGLISIMAEIMSSMPPDHALLGGNKAALVWLARFLDLLPPDQSPLPLLTAPVLVAFLTAAGHMLVNKFPEKFSEMFEQIVNDISKRLDTSPIGQPSATRLTKLLSGGLHALKSELPHGAIREYYDSMSTHATSAYGAREIPTPGSFATTTIGSQQNATQPPFGAQSQFENPSQQQFGTHTTTASSNPFGASQRTTNNTSQMIDPAMSFGTSSTPAPFGGNQTMGGGQAPGPNPYGAPATSSFGVQPNISAPPAFGYNAMVPTPTDFGNTQFGVSAPAPSQFGTNGPAPSPFGTSSGPAAQFGANPVAASPFGTNPVAASPFDTNPAAASPFGTMQAAPGPSPFSGGAATPFATVQAAPGPSPFSGGASANNAYGNSNNAFANANNSQAPFASSFGGGKPNAPQQDNRPPCRFFAQGKCRNGDNCKFSHVIPGQQGNSNNPPSQSSFGGNGGGNGWSAPSNNSKKEPCKFFAQGKCKFGAKCKNSHDTNSASASGYGNNNTYASTGFGSQGGYNAPTGFGSNQNQNQNQNQRW